MTDAAPEHDRLVAEAIGEEPGDTRSSATEPTSWTARIHAQLSLSEVQRRGEERHERSGGHEAERRADHCAREEHEHLDRRLGERVVRPGVSRAR